MSTNPPVQGNGIGLGALLFVAFLVLKLTHVIHWPWLWVCAPIWIPLALAVVVAILAFVFAVISRR